MTIRKNQILHWIWKKVNQFKAVEMVKSLTQTECLADYISIMQKTKQNFENMTFRKNQIIHWVWKNSINLRP